MSPVYHFFSICQSFVSSFFLTNTNKYPRFGGFLDLVADRTGTRLSPFGKERLYGERSKGSLPVFSSLSLGTLGYYTYRGESQKKSPEGLSDLFEVREHSLDMIEALALIPESIIDIKKYSHWSLLLSVPIDSSRTWSYLAIKVWTESIRYHIYSVSIGFGLWRYTFDLCLLCSYCVADRSWWSRVVCTCWFTGILFWIHRWKGKKI